MTTQKFDAPQKNEEECSFTEDQEPLLTTTNATRKVAETPQDLHPAGAEDVECPKDLPVEDEFKNSREDPTNGIELSASDLVRQIELEKLRLSIVTEENRKELARLQVEEIKLKTVEEETQLAKARLELRKLEGNTSSGGSGGTFWQEEVGKFAISRVVLGGNMLKRFVWLFVFVGFSSMFTYQMFLLCDNYFKYPKRTDVDILDGQVPFPAVTFCNLGGVSFYSASEWLMENKKMAEGRNNSNINSAQQGPTEDLGKELRSRKSPRYTLADEFYPEFRSEKVKRFFQKSAIPKEEFFVELRAKTKNEKTNLRGQIDIADLNIQEVDGGQYLKCYTVDVPKQTHEIQTLTLEGVILSGNGMSPNMTDVANKAEYFWWRNRPLRGTVRMFVHQSGVKINPRSDLGYIDVLPGQSAVLSFKVKQNIRVGQPYGKCSNRNPFRNDDTIGYSQKECLDMCLNHQMAEQTKFVVMYYPPLDGMTCWEDIDEYNKRPYAFIDHFWMMKYAVNLCNYTSKDVDGQSMNITVAPLYGWPAKFSFDYQSCACHPPCKDIGFDMTANIQKHELANWVFQYEYNVDLQGHRVKTNYSGRFRSGNFTVYREKTTVELGGNDDKFQFIKDYIRKDRTSAASDLVSFQISLTDRFVITTVESPMLTPSQFISDIGGQLGIWIGASVITLVEVIELSIAACCFCCRRRKKSDSDEIEEHV